MTDVYELVDYKGLVIADGHTLDEIIQHYVLREQWDGEEHEPDVRMIRINPEEGDYIYLSSEQVEAFLDKLRRHVTFKQKQPDNKDRNDE